MDNGQQGACPEVCWGGKMCQSVSLTVQTRCQPVPRAGCQFSWFIFHKLSDYSKKRWNELLVHNPGFTEPLLSSTKAPQKWKFCVLSKNTYLHIALFCILYHMPVCFETNIFKWLNCFWFKKMKSYSKISTLRQCNMYPHILSKYCHLEIIISAASWNKNIYSPEDTFIM